ncbi:arsenate reductase ArsC [Congregibacter brevis]|uniref:Arsenate reductase ArsC n=1 Tax=Congregibacter brevis TaxID=3081201 RepID=A0ABZ0IBV9_9GAMM|nr:arsenate reductase ArsC [Congregibacter sp. IMCC45268]
MTRQRGEQRVLAYSAGSQPSGEVHPDTLQQLEQRGIETLDLRSESWDAYAELAPDVVVTVCDNAAGEQCPLWLGKSIKVHWGLPDPSRIEGSEQAQAEAFATVIQTIDGWLTKVLQLDFENLSRDDLAAALQQIPNEGS